MTKKEKFYYQQGKKFIHSSFLLTLSESKDEKEKTEEEMIQNTIKAGRMAWGLTITGLIIIICILIAIVILSWI